MINHWNVGSMCLSSDDENLGISTVLRVSWVLTVLTTQFLGRNPIVWAKPGLMKFEWHFHRCHGSCGRSPPGCYSPGRTSGDGFLSTMKNHRLHKRDAQAHVYHQAQPCLPSCLLVPFGSQLVLNHRLNNEKVFGLLFQSSNYPVMTKFQAKAGRLVWHVQSSLLQSCFFLLCIFSTQIPVAKSPSRCLLFRCLSKKMMGKPSNHQKSLRCHDLLTFKTPMFLSKLPIFGDVVFPNPPFFLHFWRVEKTASLPESRANLRPSAQVFRAWPWWPWWPWCSKIDGVCQLFLEFSYGFYMFFICVLYGFIWFYMVFICCLYVFKTSICHPSFQCLTKTT